MTQAKQQRNVAIATAYIDGRTLASLAEEHGVCISRIHQIILGQGVRLGRDTVAKRRSPKGRSMPHEHRQNISKALRRRTAEGKRNGFAPIFADDPVKREEYLILRDAMGSAYAREALGVRA